MTRSADILKALAACKRVRIELTSGAVLEGVPTSFATSDVRKGYVVQVSARWVRSSEIRTFEVVEGGPDES